MTTVRAEYIKILEQAVPYHRRGWRVCGAGISLEGSKSTVDITLRKIREIKLTSGPMPLKIARPLAKKLWKAIKKT